MNRQQIEQSKLAKELHEFLQGYGRNSSEMPYILDLQLRQLMGPFRFARYQRAMQRYKLNLGTLQDVFDCFAKPVEMNLFLISEVAAASDVGAVIYSTVLPQLVPGARVADFGCATGGLLSWMSRKHPDCQFVGYDCHAKAVAFAGQIVGTPNTTFSQWDYETQAAPDVEPFDALVCSFGLETFRAIREKEATEHFAIDVDNLKTGGVYQRVHDAASAAFFSWRQVAKDGAILVAALRLPCIENLLAVVDAATETGWRLELDRSTQILVHGQQLTALVFQAVDDAKPVEEEQLIRWIAPVKFDQLDLKTLYGPEAVADYLALPRRNVIEAREFECIGGIRMHVEIGILPERAYIWHRSTDGYSQFQVFDPRFLKDVLLRETEADSLPITLPCLGKPL